MATLTSYDSHVISELLQNFDRPAAVSERGEALDESKTPGLRELVAESRLSQVVLLRRLGLFVCIAILVSVAIKPLVGGFSLFLAVAAQYFLLCRTVSRRRQEVERDLPALLTTVASSVRAGIDPLIAVATAREYFPPTSTLGRELEQFHRAVQAGAREEALIAGFCDSVRHPDLPLFRACLALSRRQGSSLAEPLHRVTRVLRQRQSFRRKTRGALVMHRMSSIGIVMCAVFIGAMQAAVNMEAIEQALVHPVGSKVLLAGVILIAGGVCWMMSLGRQSD
jgi:Flp pilus assembly protein TadB